MGFRGNPPASSLGAFYDPVKRILKLSAAGEVLEYSYGYSFVRVEWIGALKFELVCWTGPIGRGDEHYDYSQDIPIDLPNRAYPSGDVIIVTANHPKGEVVPIRWGGLRPPIKANVSSSSNPPAASPSQNTILSPPTTAINTLLGEPFTIHTGSEVPKMGKVKIAFDNTFLSMQNADIEDPNINWIFNSHQTGHTQAVVTTMGGIAGFHITRVVDINIFVLDTVAVPEEGDKDKDKAGLPLSFLGNVNIAVRIVSAAFPGAELYEVNATLPRGVVMPTESAANLSQLKVVFRSGKGTVIIKSTGWGSWSKPVYIPQPWLEDVVIPWPIKMEIDEAVKLMKGAGHTGPFWNCTLRHPLGPPGEPDYEPFYIFAMANGRYVFVGVNDKKVSSNAAGQMVVPKVPKKCD
ncbi:hypothetical protein EDC01DRAFT_785643 [Geopyxis carbonaria]|nr:hypothetical protein EDC01DRAFT_785643 [Geopyxis carbonaria]